jgi:20S proteasome alpha/beta subunit
MTAIVGVLCTDGVVIGADSASTFTTEQTRTIEQRSQKIHILCDNRIIVAGTGSVGLGQRFNAIVEEAGRGGLKGSNIEVGKSICRSGIQDFAHTGIEKASYGALVAFAIKDQPYLCEFECGSLQPEFKTSNIWYVSMGSGQLITDPFLGFIREVFWETGPPSLQDGVFAVTWTLEQAILLNPGGVNGPISIAVLEKLADGKTKARKLDSTELDEHRQNVTAAKAHLREYSRKLQSGAPATDVPKPPTP